MLAAWFMPLHLASLLGMWLLIFNPTFLAAASGMQPYRRLFAVEPFAVLKAVLVCVGAVIIALVISRIGIWLGLWESLPVEIDHNGKESRTVPGYVSLPIVGVTLAVYFRAHFLKPSVASDISSAAALMRQLCMGGMVFLLSVVVYIYLLRYQVRDVVPDITTDTDPVLLRQFSVKHSVAYLMFGFHFMGWVIYRVCLFRRGKALVI